MCYENLSEVPIKIDMVEVLGPNFSDTDNRLLSLTLVKEKMTNAVIFTPAGENKYPTSMEQSRRCFHRRSFYQIYIFQCQLVNTKLW